MWRNNVKTACISICQFLNKLNVKMYSLLQAFYQEYRNISDKLIMQPGIEGDFNNGVVACMTLKFLRLKLEN